MCLATSKNLLRYPEELGFAEASYREHGQCSAQEWPAVSQGLLELLEPFALRPRCRLSGRL